MSRKCQILSISSCHQVFPSEKGLSTTQITKELDDVYSDSAPSHHTIAKWVVEFIDPIRVFEDVPRSDRTSITLTDQSIRVVHKRS